MNRSGNMDFPSPIEVQKYLKGVDYPVDKSKLVQKAQQNNAPDEVIRMLQQLPGGSFNTPVEVMEKFGGAR